MTPALWVGLVVTAVAALACSAWLHGRITRQIADIDSKLAEPRPGPSDALCEDCGVTRANAAGRCVRCGSGSVLVVGEAEAAIQAHLEAVRNLRRACGLSIDGQEVR